jgi:predicted aspartyl protease
LQLDQPQGTKLEFLIDSGATPVIITEATRQKLGLQPLDGGQRLEGVAATGAASAPRVRGRSAR